MASLTLQETVCSGWVLLSKVPPKPVIFAVRRKYFAFGLYRSNLSIISLVMMRWVMSQYILQCISSCPLTKRGLLNSRAMCACVLQCRKHFTLTKFDHVNKDKLTWPDWPCWLCHNVLHTYELASIISITWDITNGRSYSDITNYELQLSGGGSSRNSCNVF